jgi:hypothetical protein
VAAQLTSEVLFIHSSLYSLLLQVLMRLFDGTYARVPLAHLRTGRLSVAKVRMNNPTRVLLQRAFSCARLLCLFNFV